MCFSFYLTLFAHSDEIKISIIPNHIVVVFFRAIILNPFKPKCFATVRNIARY